MIQNKKLLEYEYYLKSMSMFLNENYGFRERTKFLHKILTTIDNFYDELLKRYNFINTKENDDDLTLGDNVESTTPGAIQDSDGNWFVPNEWIDRIGRLFDVKRSFTIKWTEGEDNPHSETNLNDIKYVTLNNRIYLWYIKLCIKKMLFDGTNAELLKVYNNSDSDEMYLVYVTKTNSPGTVDIYWCNGENFTTTQKYMFLNGLLTIESMGIDYNKSIQNVTELALYDDINHTITGACQFYDEEHNILFRWA